MQEYPNSTPYPVIEQYDPKVIEFYLSDSTTHTPQTGAAGTATVKLIYGDGTTATPAGSVSEIGSGWYKIALTATETSITGNLVISVSQSGADPVNDRYTVVGAAGVNRTNWVFSHDTGSGATANGYLFTYNPQK
jgi:hypothetical protein